MTTAPAKNLLTPAWTPLRQHPVQRALRHSKARFRIVPAGRRSGKTLCAKRYGVKKALRSIGRTEWPDPAFFFAAPTRDQAKAIFWDDLKRLVPKWALDGAPQETPLTIKLLGGPRLVVVGMDKPERIEGRPWDWGVLDEYANMKKEAWSANVRPALSDRKGGCWLIGVPEGMNHYHDIYEEARSGENPDMAAFTWWSEDILDADEIESAKRHLDELTYQQEYQAAFTTFAGRIYYQYTEQDNTGPLEYNPRAPLIVGFDFNVDPGVAVVAQEMTLPNGQQGTGVIGEVWVPINSNTPIVCRKLYADWKDHQGHIFLYGDATGGSRGTAKIEGSDWDIIKEFFAINFARESRRVYLRVKDANPPERSRVNAMNSRVCSMRHERRFFIDKNAAPETHKDFMGVRVLEGSDGEIDKKHDKLRSHLSDAIGYYVDYEYPVREGDDIVSMTTQGY